MDPHEPDRRRHRRLPVRGVYAHLCLPDRSLPCEVQDISSGGALLRTTHRTSTGEPLTVSLSVPALLETLHLRGKVVPSSSTPGPTDAGRWPAVRLSFEGLARESEQQLSALVENLEASLNEPAPLAPFPEGTWADPDPVFALPEDLEEVDEGGEPPRTTAEIAPPLRLPLEALMKEISDLKRQFDECEREIAWLRFHLAEKDELVRRAQDEKHAAETALQRLCQQVSIRP